jgi:hypothetical protein
MIASKSKLRTRHCDAMFQMSAWQVLPNYNIELIFHPQLFTTDDCERVTVPPAQHKKNEVGCPIVWQLYYQLDVVERLQPPTRNPGHPTAALQTARLSLTV